MTNARVSRAKRAAVPAKAPGARTAAAKRAATKAPADRISAADLDRHRRMVTRHQEAQQHQARAGELFAAFKIWAEELHERYALNAALGEGVQDDGTIVRVPSGAPEQEQES